MYDDNETEERRKKAFKAFEPYFVILTTLFQQVATAQMKRGQTNDFESGGIIQGRIHANETIL